MLGSLTRKVVSSRAYWSQARMLNELLSITFNWFLLHPSNDISVTSIYSCIPFLTPISTWWHRLPCGCVEHPMHLQLFLEQQHKQHGTQNHWMLGSLTSKVVSPCAYWSQARMVSDLLSTFIWYLLHPSIDISVTSIYSCFLLLHSTLCRLHLGMIFISYLVILVSFLKAS